MMWDFSGGNNGAYQYPQRAQAPGPSFPTPQPYSANGGYPSSYPPPVGIPSGPSFPSSYLPSMTQPPPARPTSGYFAAPTPIPEKRERRHSSSHPPNRERERERNKLRKPSHSQLPTPILSKSSKSNPQTLIQGKAKASHSDSHPHTKIQSKPTTPAAAQPSSSHGRPQHHHHHQSSQQALSTDPRFKYSKCTGRKKALCIGINYIGQRGELRGCINDARHVRKFLTQHHGFREKDILLLTDDATDPKRRPTKKNIVDAMHWLVRSASPNDSLFFHYSGHGGQVKDTDGDEIDGWDEMIFPLDHDTHGYVIDDDMHRIMVKPLPSGCRLTALFDSCHSGTVLDLPFIYSSHGRLKGSHISSHSRKEKSTPADVISWSGCKDNQKSADTFAGGVAVGAMSHAFISSLDRNPNQNYQELLKSVRAILYPKYDQKPQLGSSHAIDTSLKFII